MKFELAATMHKGLICRQQQDAMLVAGELIQANDLPITSRTIDGEELLLAVADGVAAGSTPALASRIVLEELRRSLCERHLGRQDGFVSARHVRWVQQRLADRLFGDISR